MAPASVPDNGKTSLKEKRKYSSVNWKDSIGLNAQPTDWAMVGNTLFTSVIMTIVWVIVGADIIFYATRPFPGSTTNPNGNLDYYFPDDIKQAPYFICQKEGMHWRDKKMKCPYNGWRPNKERDGEAEPAPLKAIIEYLSAAFFSVGTIAKGKLTAGGAQTQKGGDGDFYSCTRGSLKVDTELPDIQLKPSFPYSYAGGTDNELNEGWGTANPMTAIGYLTAQNFSMGRSWVKWFFENLRPYVAGGGIGQCIVMLMTGVIMSFGGMALFTMWIVIGILCAIRAIFGQTTNYVGPYDEVWYMARGSRFWYWTAWYASYLMPVGLATWGGPFISGFMIARLVFDIVIGPLLTSDGRGTIMRILSCNAPWVMVIFGGTFLSTSMMYMDPMTWLGMAGVYGICSLYTVYRWFKRSD